MESLQIGPYETLRQTSFSAILKRYALWFAGALFLLIFLMIVNGYISRTKSAATTSI